MANLTLDTIALVSTLNPAALNGAPSSTDYNDFQTQTLLDLTSLSSFVNNILIPMFQVLPDVAATGLEGSSVYGDTTDQTALFYDSNTGLPLVISDSLRQLNSMIASNNIIVSNLTIQVGQLQQNLSSINQNNIANTLQTLTASINTINSQQISINNAISQLQTQLNNLETTGTTVVSNNNSVVLVDANTGSSYRLIVVDGVLETVPA